MAWPAFPFFGAISALVASHLPIINLGDSQIECEKGADQLDLKRPEVRSSPFLLQYPYS